MMAYEYLTDEDYETAAKRGIRKRLAYQRVYSNGWSVEKAISTPPNKPKYSWQDWKDTCPVSRETFYRRLRNGMTPEEAVSQKELPRKINRTYPIIPEEVYETAAKLGIPRVTVYARVNQYGWTHEQAMNIPLLAKNETKRYRAIRKVGGWK